MSGKLEVRIAALEVQLAEVLSRQQDPRPPSQSARHLVDALGCEAVRAEDLNSFLGRLVSLSMLYDVLNVNTKLFASGKNSHHMCSGSIPYKLIGD